MDSDAPNALTTLVAHRGHAAEWPENTLPALESAMHLGVGWVEFDIQMSADGVPVLCHDPTLRRTADLDKTVWECDWRELETVSVAETARFGERFRAVRLPSLAQAVALLERWPRVGAFVELKHHSLEKFGRDAVIDAVAAALEPIGERAVAISFDAASVARFRDRHGIRIGWVLPDWNEDIRRGAQSLEPEFLFSNKTRVPPAHDLWPGPWRWAIYEIERAAELGEWHARGAALFETMRVAEIAAGVVRG